MARKSHHKKAVLADVTAGAVLWRAGRTAVTVIDILRNGPDPIIQYQEFSGLTASCPLSWLYREPKSRNGRVRRTHNLQTEKIHLLNICYVCGHPVQTSQRPGQSATSVIHETEDFIYAVHIGECSTRLATLLTE
ncbi:MAG: hypothetical protein M1596_02915 [Firmicutes bacterium]|nr:hypothetical protein [Bacillota bacterium]